MTDATDHLAQQEIESLQDLLGDKRVAQENFQDYADTEADEIEVLEAELADRQEEQDRT